MRPKGVPNQRSLAFLNFLSARNFDPLEEFLRLYPNLSCDDKKMEAILKIMGYCYPQLKAVEVQEGSNILTVTPQNVAAICAAARSTLDVTSTVVAIDGDGDAD